MTGAPEWTPPAGNDLESHTSASSSTALTVLMLYTRLSNGKYNQQDKYSC